MELDNRRTARMTALQLISALAWGGLAATGLAADHDEPRDDEKAMILVDTMERLLAPCERGTVISVFNSRVMITNTSIASLVEDGPARLPYLLQIMRCPTVSFETFVYAYSASDQIIRANNLDKCIYWDGGCGSKTINGIKRIVPRGQADTPSFRGRVIADAEKRCSELLRPDEDKRDSHTSSSPGSSPGQ